MLGVRSGPEGLQFARSVGTPEQKEKEKQLCNSGSENLTQPVRRTFEYNCNSKKTVVFPIQRSCYGFDDSSSYLEKEDKTTVFLELQVWYFVTKFHRSDLL